MGKNEVQQNLYQGENRDGLENSSIFCEGCSVGFSRIAKEFNLRCFVVFILSLSVFVSGIFWVLPLHSMKSGFDAKYEIKMKASVQVCFKLPRPVSQLVLRIPRLEYEINGEIGVPDTKVAVLSMHQSIESNWTDVVVGFLSDPLDDRINPVSLSILRSSLIDLFLQQSNLTLSASFFGQPSIFELMKFPGGVTVIPVQSTPVWQIPQILFNFTLYNSISEIRENFVEFEEQLKSGLHLWSDENVYVQITNRDGSTTTFPVTVQASVTSNLGGLLPQRLRQLAQTITGFPAENLGLDHAVFGKVKSISLSSYLEGELHATPPSPSPAPSPEVNDYAEPSSSPSYSPASSPQIHDSPPCSNCEASSPSDSGYPYPPSPESGHFHSPAPSVVMTHPPDHCPDHDSAVPPSSPLTSHSVPASRPGIPNSPSMAPTPQFYPDPSPIPSVSYGSSPGPVKGRAVVMDSSSPAPPPSSLAVRAFYQEIWLMGFAGIMIFHHLCWLH